MVQHDRLGRKGAKSGTRECRAVKAAAATDNFCALTFGYQLGETNYCRHTCTYTAVKHTAG